MPNLQGLSKRRRWLYAFVVRLILMYGAPIWMDALSRDRRLREEVGRLMHRIALRVISAYRTVSHVSAAILSGSTPADILARRYRRTYFRIRRIRETSTLTERARRALHMEEEIRAIEEWKRMVFRLENLDPDAPSARVRDAFVPNSD